MSRRPPETATPREFDVLIQRDADVWLVGTVPALRVCHIQAKSLDERMLRIRETIELCLRVDDSPTVQLDHVGVYRIRVA